MMVVFCADFDDDILDILSDGEDTAPKKRTKPVIQLNKTPRETDSKLITSNTDEPERPGTSRGKPHAHRELPSFSEPIQEPTPAKQDNVLKVHDTRPAKTKSKEKNAVSFDDNDDILGGLGFETEQTPSKPRGAMATSRLDDLLGVNKSEAKSTAPKTSRQRNKDIAKTNPGNKDDDFQFGGYVPSSIEAPPKRSGLKLPSGRRRGENETITTRPSTAPSPAKKSVHFAETLEVSDRPQSSTSGEPRRSLMKNEPMESEEKVPEPLVEDKPSESRYSSTHDCQLQCVDY